jgi:Abnormal spindle-like microcephaly-assoc'd, ASPM-SPD-2-Hydin
MKNIVLPAVLLASLLTPAFAITDAEITPAALVGKTLTFAIVNGGAPYASTGTWSGSFAASGGGFTAAKITGDFANISTTYTAAILGTFTEVALAKFVEGQAPATLLLYTLNGVGNYEAYINGLNGISLNGTFTFGTAVVPSSEISVQQPVGTELADGRSRKSFGPVKVGKVSAAKVFTIKNTGKAALTGLAISKSGKNSADFSTSALTKTRLAPGASMTFKASFKPKTKGVKKAVIQLKSNDKDESPFDIPVTGSGM